VKRGTAVGGAATVAVAVATVVTALTVPGVGAWWNRHSLVGSFVASVLILALTVQVIDQVTARRSVKERERIAAVQALIVFGQVLRTEKVLMTPDDQRQSGDTVDEVRALASMVLTAAPALFEDPVARTFMEQIEHFSSMLIRIGLGRRGHEVTDADRAKVSESKASLTASFQPLLSRLDPHEVSAIEADAVG
jgi:hypothetical protein